MNTIEILKNFKNKQIAEHITEYIIERVPSFSKASLLAFLCMVNVACVTEGDTKAVLSEPTKDLKSKAQAHSELAASYINIGKYEVAQNELKKAIEADPDYSGSYFVAGVLAMKLGSPEDAEKNFRIAQKDERNSAASHELGVLLCRTGRAKESIQYFDKAISNPLFPNKGMSNLRAGECITRLDLKRAEKYLSAVLVENPALIVALYRLAEVYFIDDKLLRARAHLERYKAAAGASPQALFLGYRIENKAKSVKAADEYSEQLLKQFPGSEEAKSLRKEIGLRG